MSNLSILMAQHGICDLGEQRRVLKRIQALKAQGIFGSEKTMMRLAVRYPQGVIPIRKARIGKRRPGSDPDAA